MSNVNNPAVRADAATLEDPWSVSRVAESIRAYIDRLGSIWIEGEITQWGVSAGNVYGKLKDLEADATISFSIWNSTRSRLSDDFKQGDRVKILGKPNFWAKGGTLTFIVSDVRKAGIGDLLERIERLRQQLGAEGLFEASRKKKLPFLPKLIGLITAKDSDAEKDVIRNAQLRWPSVQFRTVHAAVQGERNVPEVLAALETLDADPEVDVIIIARGGGDFQNLLGFSDEALVRRVAAAQTPVVSAIGHEADRPILDEVADLRASTPTDAAKRVVPDVVDETLKIRQARNSIWQSLSGTLNHEIAMISGLRSRPALAGTAWIFEQRFDELGRTLDRSRELTQRILERSDAEQRELLGRLRSLSPQSTLKRGYAIVQLNGDTVLSRAEDAAKGDTLRITLASGHVAATVSGTEE
ncbi:MAG: exodeoxyribonuclease VII large subunit [Microbacteriaceae bacterium]